MPPLVDATSRIKKIFSYRITSLCVTTIAFTAMALTTVYFTAPESDKSFQVQVAQNLLEGHGPTTRQVFAGDLSAVHFIQMARWPPGYSIFLLPFLWLSNSDFVLSTVLLDIVTAFFFVLLSRKILRHIGLPLYWINIYSLISGFFIFQFCTRSTSDFHTLTLYMGAYAISLPLIKSTGKRWGELFLLASLLFLTGFTRYMFIPVAFVIPIYLAAVGRLNKNKALFNKGLAVLTLLMIFTFIFLSIQKLYSGNIGYLTPATRGFYPGQLLKFYPFCFSAILDIDFFGVQLEKFAGISYEAMYSALTTINYFLLLALLFIFAKWIKKKKLLTFNLADHYILLGTLSSLAIIFLLIYLSLTNKLISHHWTYVEEGRYLAFDIFFLHQLLFLVISRYNHSLRRAGRVFVFTCFGILTLNSIHGAYFAFKLATVYHYSQRTQKSIQLLHYSDALLGKLMKENKGRDIVISGPVALVNNYVAVKYSIPALDLMPDDDAGKLQARKKTLLILVVPQDNNDSLKATPIGNFDNKYYYSINVGPAEK